MVRRRIDNQQVTIRRLLQTYGERAVQAARQSIKDNAETLAQAARERCPVKTGRLRNSIHVERDGLNAMRVVADAKDDRGYCYAPIIEYAPYGQPFMRPAYEAKKTEMINHSREMIRAAILNDTF